MLTRHNTVIIYIDINTKTYLFLKFIIKNGKLYAYNNALSQENKKLLEVTKINGVDVSSFIDKIDVNDLYSIEAMKPYGIDTTHEFICELLDNDNIIKYDILNPKISADFFYKKHALNEFISSDIASNIEVSVPSTNLMLEYASSNIKGLLSMLNNMTKSNGDKNIFTSIFQKISSINNTYNSNVDNLDMIFLSNQMLLLNEKITYVPKYIEDIIKKYILFDFSLGNLQDTNNSILTKGNIDYKKVIKMMRNCIAHSNYKVLDDGKIEFYNEKKNKLNFTINKRNLITIFNRLYDFYYLYGKFPVIYSNTVITDPYPFDENSLIEYLQSIELLGNQGFTLKRFDSEEEQNMMDEMLEYDLQLFNYNNHYPKEFILRSFNIHVKKHIEWSDDLTFKSLTSEDITYILDSINEMGKDYFYQLSKTSQINVINSLIQQRYNREYYILNNLYEIINSDYDTNESLNKKSYSYINYKIKIELMITAILNNLLLFCFNQNESTVECSNLRFPMAVYNDYLNSQKRNIYDYSQELIIEKEKLKETSKDNKKLYDGLSKKINFLASAIAENKEKQENVNLILQGKATVETYKTVNLDILNRIRNCLAHSRLKIDIANLEKIGEAKLYIYDKYYGKTKFASEISLNELLTTIQDDDFIKSILNDNQNFEHHRQV